MTQRNFDQLCEIKGLNPDIIETLILRQVSVPDSVRKYDTCTICDQHCEHTLIHDSPKYWEWLASFL